MLAMFGLLFPSRNGLEIPEVLIQRGGLETVS
jgi:hypothetical protein